MTKEDFIEKANLIRLELKVVEKDLKEKLHKLYLEFFEEHRQYSNGVGFSDGQIDYEIIGPDQLYFNSKVEDNMYLMKYKCKIVSSRNRWMQVGDISTFYEQTIRDYKNRE